MRARPLLLCFACAPLLLDCRSLPDIPLGACGNAVVDPGEDCDTYPRGAGTQCNEQCRLACGGASGATCPTGWGCGTDGICRQPSGRFERASAPVAAGAWRVSTGDFDGDGRSDVLARAAIDFDGASKVRLHYFEPQSDHSIALAKALVLAPLLASPTVADFNGDGLDDFAFIRGGIGVMLGGSDRTLTPVAYPAFTIPHASVRVALVREYLPPNRPDIAIFAKTQQGAGVELSTGAGSITPLFGMALGPDDLGGDLVAAPFLDDPKLRSCDTLVFAFKGAAGADLYTPCKIVNGSVAPDPSAKPIHVALPSGSTIDRGACAGDVDGDGHVDLLLGSADSTFVAYGDGKGDFHDASNNPGVASAYAFTVNGVKITTRVPLDAADVNGDGRADFIVPGSIIVSVPQSTEYVIAAYKTRGGWTAGKFADMNGDGLLDAVASSAGQLDADFFVGTGTTFLNQFSIATGGAVSHLAVGDFDGDRLNDVAFSEVAADPTQPDELTIAFGHAFGAPDPPVGVGQFNTVDEVLAAPRAEDPAIWDLGIVSNPPGDTTTAIIAFLVGSGDRQPLATYELSGQVDRGAQALALAAGPFATPGKVDLVALGANANGATPDGTFSFWLARAAGGAQFGAPIESQPLPKELHPMFVGTDGTLHLALLMGSGRIDGSGVPEVIAAAPFGRLETESAIVVGKANGANPPQIASQAPSSVPARVSPEGQFEFFDVDGDGLPDAVVLTGTNSTSRDVRVVWNLGGGKFDPAGNSLVVNASADVPQGFAFVPVDTSGRARIAYIARKAVVLATIDSSTRAVSQRTTIDTPLQGSGIAAGDVDGDGVVDLAIADEGNVIILRDKPVLE